MRKAKRLITDELLKKFEEAFQNKKSLVANDGLSRKELRILERKGYVKKQLMKGLQVFNGRSTGAFVQLYTRTSILGKG